MSEEEHWVAAHYAQMARSRGFSLETARALADEMSRLDTPAVFTMSRDMLAILALQALPLAAREEIIGSISFDRPREEKA